MDIVRKNTQKKPPKNTGKTTRKKNIFDKELQLIQRVTFESSYCPNKNFPQKSA